MLAGPGPIKASSDADTLQPGLCLLFDFSVNHFQRSIASLMHSLDHLLINVDSKSGTEKKTHSILPLSAIMVGSPEDTGILDPTIRAAPPPYLVPWQEIRNWEGGTWSTGKMFAATTQVAIVNTAWESKDDSKDHLNEDETPMNELEKLFEKATFDQWD
ncbi:hypothetical protein N7536_011985 [Penicillium majusculum]|uniref:Uncharacterized protein n=1 Tax=Penicillium solitum TaxID=60172 RepID=A0A1V6R5R8_9EURO|nr:uncharacterized protein PENSOL_c014G04790 [Penicillium solitum]KAJ5680846.1 hypothetical protein N7536_011985 [Penicillium majusculum]OQD96849.1 hypothetical protein PENSOL_c014G04790 [Penicillium solitum]